MPTVTARKTVKTLQSIAASTTLTADAPHRKPAPTPQAIAATTTVTPVVAALFAEGGSFRAFSDDSIWNTPIPEVAVRHGESSAFVAWLKANMTHNYLRLAPGTAALPVYFATSGDPSETINPSGDGPTVTFHLPLAATARASDGAMVVIDASTNQDVRLTGFNRGGMSATASARYYLNSNGLEGTVRGGANVDNLGYRGLPGAIHAVRTDEVIGGVIRHRTKVSIGVVGTPPFGAIWPMPDFDAGTGLIPEGVVMRIKPSYVLPATLTPNARIIAQHLKDYGTIVGDTAAAGSATLTLQDSTAWTGLGVTATGLKDIPWDAYEFIISGEPPWVPLFGSHRRHDTGTVTGDSATAHLAAEAVAGRVLGFRCYGSLPMGTSGAGGTTRLNTLMAEPTRPLYLALAGSTPWANVAAGTIDAQLDAWGAWLATHAVDPTDRPIVVTFHHEPENDGLGTPEEYVAAFNHVVTRCSLKDYPNVRILGAALTDGGWQGAPIGTNTNRPDPRRWYIGMEGVIDLVGGDHYTRYPDSGQLEQLSTLAANGVAQAVSMGLPYFVGEMGCNAAAGNATSQQAKADWITNAYGYLASISCGGALYSDVDATSPITGHALNYRVDSDPVVLAAWQAVNA